MMRILENVTIFDVERNTKENLDFASFNKFCMKVRTAKVKKLDVKGIAKLDLNDKQALLKALINNFYVECFIPAKKFFNKEEGKELKIAFARNRLLSSEKQYQNFLVEYFEQHSKADAEHDVDQVLKMIEDYQKQNEEVREALAPYACEARMARLKRRMDVLMTYASAWMKKSGQFGVAIEYYLDISASNSQHIPARFAAFEIAYSLYYDKNKAKPVLNAYIDALVCALDDYGRIPRFEDKKQNVFDRLLCQAADIKTHPTDQFLLDEGMRKFLLRFVLMSSVFQLLSSANNHSVTIFQPRDNHLKRQFLTLPSFNSLNDVSLLMKESAFSSLWNKMNAAIASMDDQHLKVLFKAVTKDKANTAEEKLPLRKSFSMV